MLFASAALITGCQKEDIVKEDPGTDKGIKVTATASVVDRPDTRLGNTENATSMSFVWKNPSGGTESFYVYAENAANTTTFPYKWDPIQFTLTDGNNSNSGTFTGTIPADTPEGTKLFAFYGGGSNDGMSYDYNDEKEFLYSPYHLGYQPLVTSASGLDDNELHLMYAEATYEGEGQPLNFSFKHMVSILKLTIELPTGATAVNKFILSGVHTLLSINMKTGVHSYIEDEGFISILVRDETGSGTLTDNKLTAYLYLFPEDLTDKQLTLEASDVNGRNYKTTFSGRNIEVGKVYTKSVTLTPKTYAIGDYFPDEYDFEGLVCSITDGGIHGKAISFEEMKDQGDEATPWATGSAATTQINVTDKDSGAENMKKVLATGDSWGTNYPAFKWCADTHTRVGGNYWYIPSVNEIKLVREANKDDFLNNILKDTMFNILEGYWVASSEDSTSPTDKVDLVDFSTGELVPGGKLKNGTGSTAATVKAMINF